MKKYFSKSLSHLYLIVLILLAFTSTGWATNTPTLRNGFYRFAIQRQDGREIIFISEISIKSGKKILYIINGSDRLLADDLSFRDDSVYIRLPFFESELKAKLSSNGNLTGVWERTYNKRKQSLPFMATFNESRRFVVTTVPTNNISGRWSVRFHSNNGKVTEAVGEFQQQGSHLTGTFRTSTGDYRFLEGVVSGDSLYLSGFDGAGAKLFVAHIKDGQTITDGSYYSGSFSNHSWTAVRNNDATLPDEYALTQLKSDTGKLNFSFPDITGKSISITDKKFRNKVVVIQIMGSWCPNCMDEARFISENYNKYHNRGVEFMALSYEPSTDFDENQKALQPFIRRFNIQYPLLLTGVAVSDTLRTEKTIPQIEKIKAFPTTLFVDKKGSIKKIHSGFDGPATGEHYVRYKNEFDAIINDLLTE